MTDPTTIRDICSRLDPEDDTHWTSQGLPRMDVLAAMGLTVERRELNEALPGFNRLKAAEARSANPTDELAARAPAEVSETTLAALSNKRIGERAARRRAALAHLEAGGFSLKDLQDTASPLQRRIAHQNRQARKELGAS